MTTKASSFCIFSIHCNAGIFIVQQIPAGIQVFGYCPARIVRFGHDIGKCLQGGGRMSAGPDPLIVSGWRQ